MGWHSTWDKPEWNNEDVKYLLADLCNAVNERKRTGKVNWLTYSGTSQTPSASDFAGCQVTGAANSWSKVVEQLLNNVHTSGYYLFDAEDPFVDSEALTYSLALSSSGLVEDDISTDLWRNKTLYSNLRTLVTKYRYRAGGEASFSTLTDVSISPEPDYSSPSPGDNQVTVADACALATTPAGSFQWGYFKVEAHLFTYPPAYPPPWDPEDISRDYFNQVTKSNPLEVEITLSRPTGVPLGATRLTPYQLEYYGVYNDGWSGGGLPAFDLSDYVATVGDNTFTLAPGETISGYYYIDAETATFSPPLCPPVVNKEEPVYLDGYSVSMFFDPMQRDTPFAFFDLNPVFTYT